MSSFSQDQLFEIKSRINLADLLEEYGLRVHRVGGSAKVCCPFHQEKTPSFHINIEKNFYKCFGCGESGDVLTFVQKYEGLTFIDALKKLADRAGVKLESKTFDPEAKLRERLYAIHQGLAAFYQRCLQQTREGQIARDYLNQRQLSDEIVKQFQIGYAPDRNDALLQWAQKHNYTPEDLVAAGVLAPSSRDPSGYYDRFRGRLVFPICDVQGRVVAFSCRLLKDRKHTGKYVNSPETAIFKKSNILYALNHARANIVKASPRRALICEGQIDVIRCHACGFNTAIASQGTAFTEDHVSILKRYADTVDLLFDGDKAGIKASIRTLGHFLSQGIPVRIVNLPEGEDPDSFLVKQGEEAFRLHLDHAIDPAPYLVARLREQEAHPDAMDAMMRIARTAILSIIDCPEPILTARFIKDLADILGLPSHVLEEDLKLLREDAAEASRRREAFQARQALDAPPTTNITQQPTSNNTPIDVEDDHDFIPIDEGLPPSDFIDYEPTFNENDAPIVVPDNNIAHFDLIAIQNLNDAFCELLAHYFTDPEVMACLIQHLPPSFVHNPYAAKLYDLTIEATLKKQNALSPDKNDEAFVQFLAEYFSRPDRILSTGEEVSPLTFTRDIIKQFWLNEFRLREQHLDPDSDEAYEMTLSRRRLEALDWEKSAPFMDALNPLLSAPPPTHLTPSTPPTRKDPEPIKTSPEPDLHSTLSETTTLEDTPTVDVIDEFPQDIQEDDDLYAML